MDWTLPCKTCSVKCEKVKKISDCKRIYLDECIHLFHDVPVNYSECPADMDEGVLDLVMREGLCGTTKCPMFTPAIEFDMDYEGGE